MKTRISMNLLRCRQAAAMVTAALPYPGFLRAGNRRRQSRSRRPGSDQGRGLRALASDGKPLLDVRGLWSARHQQPQSQARRRMGDEADERVGTSERPPGKVALRLRVADQAFLRSDGDSGLRCVYGVPAGMDAGDERPHHGRAGMGADPLESGFRQVPWQAEGQGAADVRPGSAHAPHAGRRAAFPNG